MDKADGVTVSMRNCYAGEITVQDKRLNDNYKKYISGMSIDVKRNFINGQRQWVKFRGLNCSAFALQEESGTLSSVIADSCYLKITAQRADDFNL
ncbi:lysozyme inhibitor LprI family protein [Erwinia amylovora]|nr:lysozyme inhibitor LprI family protein [Erwinia amylovora]